MGIGGAEKVLSLFRLDMKCANHRTLLWLVTLQSETFAFAIADQTSF
jgi:hypothetical protein